MTIFEGIILGLIQGLTEFIPVSSSGHLIIVRDIFGWNGTNDLSIDAILQLATILALLVYFRKDLSKMFMSFFMPRGAETVQNRRLAWAIIFGTIPALVFGFFLEGTMETVFRSATLVAWALVAGSALMFIADLVANKTVISKEIGFGRGFVIGIFQAMALVPGISRSGATISGGLFAGLNREEATRFGFLLAVPIIVISGLKKLFDLIVAGSIIGFSQPLIIGSLVAFISGLFAIHWLLSFVKKHSLRSFIIYRIVVAFIIFIWL